MYSMQLSLATFWNTFLMAVNIYYPESVDPALKPEDTPQSALVPEYDFIVVGAGSAGCVVTSRLTENLKWKVLLIEAGGDEDAVSDAPYLTYFLQNSDKDWNYTTVKQKNACLDEGGICKYPRGRVMGGSSTINYMGYVRGNKEDFNDWERAGNIGWGYNDVLPYFIKAENNRDPFLTSSPTHGTNGPLSVQYPRFRTNLRYDFISASQEVGFRFGDYNNGDQNNVVGYFQYTMKGPSRHSTSRAYLNPVRNRRNLDVIKRSMVTKILIEGKVAKGVRYVRNGKQYEIFAREVILCAGAIDTPKILMLSGLGPRGDLEKLGISVVEDLPVGKALIDHPLINVFFELQNAATITPDVWRTYESILEYAKERRGPLTTFPSEVSAFYNPLNRVAPPTVQINFNPGYADLLGAGNKTILWFAIGLIHPRSIGSVKLKSNDFTDPPLIDPRYFEKEIDIENALMGIDKVFEVMRSPSMRKYSPKVFTDIQPGCQNLPAEDYKKCVLTKYSGSYYHPVGTAKMGPSGDMNSVVCSADLNVRGIKNLRVIDASVMPQIPRGNINAPIIMIAEKGSDLIKLSYEISSEIGYRRLVK